MQGPLEVSYRDLEPSDLIRNLVEEKFRKVERLYPDLTGCHIMIEQLNQRHQSGNLYHVRIDLFLPGKELVISSSAHDKSARQDLYQTIVDAFETAHRRLDEYLEKRRARKKG